MTIKLILNNQQILRINKILQNIKINYKKNIKLTIMTN